MSVLERLRSAVVVAVVRAPDPDSALTGIGALVAGGVRAVEVTYSTPNAAAVIAQLRRDLGEGVVVGAGTVTSGEQAAESAAAGAEFLVSPGTTERVAAAMRETGVPFALGTLTPSEVMRAVELGAEMVKVFPGSVGGPAFLRALREPFPDVPLMPTGGVSPDNVREWLDAGAFCVGAGGSLLPKGLLADGDLAAITERARTFVAAAAPKT
jgi:2-dehydro-3-deoxyphosphogluconate aldolase / (4S)-4-hydroxy-2-oxoglutarate aldolase